MSNPLDLAVETFVPLQQVTKWASHRAIDPRERMNFLMAVAEVGGVEVIMKFMNSHINNPVAVMCCVRALRALLDVQAGESDDWEIRDTNLPNVKLLLIGQFLAEQGLEILTRAFGLFGLVYDGDDGEQSFSRLELRAKIMDVLAVTTPFTTPEKGYKLLKFWCRVAPKMLPPFEEANVLLMEKLCLCVTRTLEVKGVGKNVSIQDEVDVVNISMQALKACKNDDNARLAANARRLWATAGRIKPAM